MSKQLLVLVALCSAMFASSLDAQQAQPAPQSGRIIGRVLGDVGPLVAAEVLVRAANDTTVLARGATAKDGRFLVDALKFGTYRLRIEYLGFKAYQNEKVSLTATEPVAELGTITMQRALIAHGARSVRR